MREDEHDARCEAAIEAMHEVSGAVIAIVLVLCAVFIPVAFLGGIAGAALPAVRGHGRDRGGDLGLHRADAHAGAVRAAAEARRTTSRASSGRSTAASRGSRRRFLGGVDLRAAASRRLAADASSASSRSRVLLFWRVPTQLRARRGPGLHHRHDPAARRRDARSAPPGPARSCSRCMPSDPAIDHMFVITGFDLIGGGNKTNAATIFILLKHWDERKKTAPQLAAEVTQQGRRRFATASRSPSTRRRSAASAPRAASRSTCRRAPTPTRSASSQVDCRASPPRCAKHPQLHGINTFFRPTVPQLLRRGRPREGDGARRAGRTTCSTRCRARWARST